MLWGTYLTCFLLSCFQYLQIESLTQSGVVITQFIRACRNSDAMNLNWYLRRDKAIKDETLITGKC